MEKELQLTFSEEEVQDVAEFINFVYRHASWRFETTKVGLQLQNHMVKMKDHLGKMEDHIFEVKKIYKANDGN